MTLNINNRLSYLTHILQAARVPDTWQKLETCDVLLVRADANCGYTYDGKAYAHLLDSLGDLLINRGLVIRSVATPYSKLTETQAHNFPVSYNRSAFFAGLLKRLVRLVRGSASSMEWFNERRTDLWCRILEKAKPGCVIGIQPEVGLCRAGKIKGIPVYDLQHGVIDDNHLWYAEKYRRTASPKDLPVGFLCWDETSAAALRKWAPQKGIDIRVVGNLWFARFLFAKTNDFLVQEAVNTGRIFNNNRPVILVSLQWVTDLLSTYPGFKGVMVDALEKTILETADSYNWLLRLHPIQRRGSETERTQVYLTRTFGHLESVEWRICSELPLPVILQQVDLHITHWSSVVIEASWMGVYSALLNIAVCPGGKHENIYAHERALGMAEVLPINVNIIKQWIEDTLTKGRGEPTLKNYQQALETFIEEIATATRVERKHS